MKLLHSAKLLRATAAIALAICAAFRFAPAGNISVKITDIPKQVFKGFGASVAHQGSQSSSYASLSQSTRDEIARMMWSDEGAGFRFLRLWINHDLSGAKNASQYKRVVDDARKAQSNLMVLQAPNSRIYVFDKGAPISNLQSYASTFCSRLAIMRESGVRVDATGVANEPNDHKICRDAGRMTELIRHFRTELDNRGCSNVKLIAPESGSVDSIHFAYLNAIKNHKETLNSLDGIGAHSYNMGSNQQMVEWVEETGLEYWQTEASVDESWSGREQDRTAAIVAGKILCDLNNRVSCWLYFLGIHGGGAHGTKLIGFTRGNPVITRQFRYMSQIAKRFRPGAVVRYSETDKELPRKNMEWQYGQKPAVCAAAAHNTDGSFVIGIANTTGCGITDTYNKANVGWSYDPEEYTVSLFVEELSHAASIGFLKYSGTNEQGQAVTMKNGYLEVTLKSRELVCFESQEPIDNPVRYRPEVLPQPYAHSNIAQCMIFSINGQMRKSRGSTQPAGGIALYKWPGTKARKHIHIQSSANH